MDKKAFDKAFSQLLAEALSLIPEMELPDLPSLPPENSWYSFELQLWAKGEEIRQLIQAANQKMDEPQVLAILSICENRRGRRGRQSFLMLLGRKACALHADAVIQLLPDPHLTSHAINTLYKMHAGGYASQVAPYRSHPQSLIRKEAKRYLQKYQETSRNL